MSSLRKGQYVAIICLFWNQAFPFGPASLQAAVRLCSCWNPLPAARGWWRASSRLRCSSSTEPPGKWEITWKREKMVRNRTGVCQRECLSDPWALISLMTWRKETKKVTHIHRVLEQSVFQSLPAHSKAIKFSACSPTRCLDVYSKTFWVQTSEYPRATQRKEEGADIIPVYVNTGVRVHARTYTHTRFPTARSLKSNPFMKT